MQVQRGASPAGRAVQPRGWSTRRAGPGAPAADREPPACARLFFQRVHPVRLPRRRPRFVRPLRSAHRWRPRTGAREGRRRGARRPCDPPLSVPVQLRPPNRSLLAGPTTRTARLTPDHRRRRSLRCTSSRIGSPVRSLRQVRTRHRPGAERAQRRVPSGSGCPRGEPADREECRSSRSRVVAVCVQSDDCKLRSPHPLQIQTL